MLVRVVWWEAHPPLVWRMHVPSSRWTRQMWSAGLNFWVLLPGSAAYAPYVDPCLLKAGFLFPPRVSVVGVDFAGPVSSRSLAIFVSLAIISGMS